MAKNRVQFQKGLSFKEFQKQIGTEEQCWAALFRSRWPQGFRCPACDHDRFCRLSIGRYQCNACHHQTILTALTAGTIFAGNKLPLATWFLAITLLTQSKNAISALELKRQLGVSYNTAWLIKHKLLQVMKEKDDKRPLEGLVQIDDAYRGGERHGGKGGRGAPGKTPFVAAVQCREDGHPHRLCLTRVQGFSRKEMDRWSAAHLPPAVRSVRTVSPRSGAWATRVSSISLMSREEGRTSFPIRPSCGSIPSWAMSRMRFTAPTMR